jgi:hypothetical protein
VVVGTVKVDGAAEGQRQSVRREIGRGSVVSVMSIPPVCVLGASVHSRVPTLARVGKSAAGGEVVMERSLRVLSWLAVVLYVGVGTLELLFADGPLGHRVLFAAVLTGFAVLVLSGVRLIGSRPWIGVAVASVGAVLGGFALFWTVAAIALAVAIVVLSVLVARRSSGLGAQPA